MLPLRDSSTQFHCRSFRVISSPLFSVAVQDKANPFSAFPLLFDTLLLPSSPSHVNSEQIRCRSSRIDTMLFLCYSALIYSSTARHISVPMPFPTDLFLCIAFLSVALPFLCKAILRNSFPLHFLHVAFYPLKYLSSSI